MAPELIQQSLPLRLVGDTPRTTLTTPEHAVVLERQTVTVRLKQELKTAQRKGIAISGLVLGALLNKVLLAYGELGLRKKQQLHGRATVETWAHVLRRQEQRLRQREHTTVTLTLLQQLLTVTY